jgi:DNA-binding NarL/FixJ family response regulator
VVQGFIEGKTNHELSLELGFSISTIRHETMAIFKTLGASDRKEAAKIAQEQYLI